MSQINQGSPFVTACYFAKPDGIPYLISEVSSWSVYIFDESTKQLAYSLTGQTPVAIGSGGQFSNSPINDGSWPYGPPGYTFKNKVSGAAFTQVGGTTYRVEYVVVLLDGTVESFFDEVYVVPMMYTP